MSYVADEDVYRRFEKHYYVLSFIHCHGICVYIVFLLFLKIRLVIILPAELLKKELNKRLFFGMTQSVSVV